MLEKNSISHSEGDEKMKRILAFLVLLALAASAPAMAAPGWWDDFMEFSGTVGDELKDVWNSDEVQGVIEGGKEALGQLAEGIDTFLSGEATLPRPVVDAWNTLKEGASQAGDKGREAMQQAYITLYQWAEENDLLNNQVWLAIRAVAEAAGVDVDQVK